MKFQPKSEEEIGQFDLLAQGIYDFEIIKAKDEISKAGNGMIVLELDVYSKGGKKYRIFDYITDKVDYKIRHFCHAIGLEKEYLTGCIDADSCLSRGGRCIVTIQKDKDGQYKDKNIIRDYIPDEQTEEDIPF